MPIIGFVWPAVNDATREIVSLDASWDSGEISDAHKFFGDDCKTCHQTAFSQVTDTSCLACHAKVEGHAHKELKVTELEQRAVCPLP